MTSSDAPNDGFPSAPEVGPEVLASGHLHPGMLFLRFLDGLRGVLLPIGLGLITQTWWLAALGGAWFVLTMAYALARYVTFQYVLTTEELVTREGILHRQERRIPVNRIQDLSFESTLIRRFFGLVVVSVETASGTGAEASLDSLGRVRAEQLREALYHVRRSRGVSHTAVGEGAGVDSAGLAGADWVAPEPEFVLLRVSSGELAIRGLTDVRIGAVLMGVYALWEYSGSFGLGSQFSGLVERGADWLGEFSWPLATAILGGALFVVLLVTMGFSVLGMIMVFHNFALTLRGGVLQRRYGLFTTRASTLPIRKVQRVLLEQNVLRRMLRVAVVRADSAGSGMSESEEAKSGRDLVVPLAALPRAEALLPVLLPEVGQSAPQWCRVSPLLVWRVTLKGVVLAAILMAFLWPGVGSWALFALALIPAGWVVGRLEWHNLAYSVEAGHAALRWGIIGRYRAFVPYRKVQAVTLRAGPLERVLGLAHLTVYVAGGSPTVLTDLAVEDARALREDLVQFAARSPFRW